MESKNKHSIGACPVGMGKGDVKALLSSMPQNYDFTQTQYNFSYIDENGFVQKVKVPAQKVISSDYWHDYEGLFSILDYLKNNQNLSMLNMAMYENFPDARAPFEILSFQIETEYKEIERNNAEKRVKKLKSEIFYLGAPVKKQYVLDHLDQADRLRLSDRKLTVHKAPLHLGYKENLRSMIEKGPETLIYRPNSVKTDRIAVFQVSKSDLRDAKFIHPHDYEKIWQNGQWVDAQWENGHITNGNRRGIGEPIL